MRGWCIGLLVCLPWAALAEASVVMLQPQLLSSDADALPRLAETNEAAQKINAQLAISDRNALEERSECLFAGALSDWSRSTHITFAGPDYLGLMASAGGYCDGAAHPYNYTHALTFDLATGEPLDWRKALPGAFADAEADYDPPPSPVLSALFLAATSPWPVDCESDLTSGPLAFRLWLDAEKHAIGMYPVSLAYASQACGDVAYLTPSQAKTLGAEKRLLDALANADPIPVAVPLP